MANFDFDRWCDLAQRDPEAFCRARRRAIESLIEAHPPVERERLRALQQRIDCECACAGTPANALQFLLRLMHERLAALQRHNEVLLNLAVDLEEALRRDAPPG